MTRVAGAVSGWRDAARRNGIREQEITMMADSIEVRLGALVGAARGVNVASTM
jgi:serine/threonine-protein kinase HipA